ncbi:hypothetical protein E8E14_009576 [Neopestalotiopsis sp. 37M]|nr:hypothetical protein E8E14_009576 [Neopestalotiopsis sp. 37M]
MKTFAAISALFLSAVSAAPLEQRQVNVTEFDVTKFSANTLPHGTGAFISFNVEIPGVISTSCSYSNEWSVGRLPDVTPYRICAVDSFSWSLRQVQAGPTGPGPYLLVILFRDGNGVITDGSKEWPSSDFPFEDEGTSNAQFYRGAPDFVITA